MDEGVYLVEAIVSKKTIKSKTFYNVKWQGFPSEQNTWEPEENLEACKKLIEQFERPSERVSETQSHTQNNSTKQPSVGAKRARPVRSKRVPKVRRRGIDLKKVAKKPIDPGRVLHRILSLIPDPVTNDNFFVVQWADAKDRVVDIVSCKSLNQRFPAQVIEFYQSKIILASE